MGLSTVELPIKFMVGRGGGGGGGRGMDCATSDQYTYVPLQTTMGFSNDNDKLLFATGPYRI